MLILILGLPGSGKSTLARLLEQGGVRDGAAKAAPAGLTYLHPGKHARAKGWVKSLHSTRAELLAIPQLAESFLSAVQEALKAGDVIVDGFPRTKEQAELLALSGLRYIVVHLAFPAGRELEFSVARQEKRVKDDGVTVVPGILEEQSQIGLKHDQAAIDYLLSLKPPTITVDALLPIAEVETAVRTALLVPAA